MSNSSIRKIETDNIDALGAFHVNKNREYTQFTRGKMQAHVTEISLNQAQIMRESLNVGTRIEAAPADCFLPFAVVLPQSSPYQFCGAAANGTPFIQASGGVWEIKSKLELDYVATVFLREHFLKSFQTLTGIEPNANILTSRLTQTSSTLQRHYAHQVLDIMRQIIAQPKLLQDNNIQRLICSQLIKLTVDIINPMLSTPEPINQFNKRQQGINRVVEYIREHCQQLPDITQLCQIAQLSERSLQYGFKERFGITPVHYLRVIRLNGAHKQLLTLEKSTMSVAQIALNWGFVEFGRFSRDYKALFDQLPSQTLATAIS